MNVTDFFDILRKEGFTTSEIFALIAYTPIDIKVLKKKNLKQLIPGFKVLLQKMVEYEDFIDRLLDTEPEP